MKAINLNFKNNIVNFSNSILKHYGAPTFHTTIFQIDELMKHHKKIAVLLFDGMGQCIIKKHLDKKSYIRKHYTHTMEATFPPTTVASTSALLTGLYPIENGWFGWRQYFEKYHRPILVFRNMDPDTEKVLAIGKNSIMNDYYCVPTIFELIKKYSSADVFDIKQKPANDDGPETLEEAYQTVDCSLNNSDHCFLYLYWESPDAVLHRYGVDSNEAKKSISVIEKFVQKLVETHPDTLFFTLADHGHVDVVFLHVYEHKDFVDTFLLPPTFEGRTTNFFVKEEEKKHFVNLFNKYYGDKKFILLTKEEILKMHLFGESNGNEKTLKFLGDYFAIATDKYSFELNRKLDPSFIVKAHHAGYTKEEMLIDISVYNK